MVTIISREPFKSQFMSALSNLLHSSSNSSITTLVIRLIGQMGGQTRTVLRDRIDLTSFSFSRKMLVQYEANNLFCMDPYVMLAVSLIERNLIVKSLGDSEIKLSRTIACSTASILHMRNIRKHYKQAAVNCLETIFYLCCEKGGVLLLPTVTTHLRVPLDSPDAVERHSNAPSQEHDIISLLFYGLLLACCDVEIRDEASAVLRRIVCYLTGLMLNHTIKTPKEVESLLPSQYYHTLNVVVSGVVPSLSPFMINFPAGCLSPQLLLNGAIALLEREIPTVADVVLDMLMYMREVLLHLLFDEGALRWVALPSVELPLMEMSKHTVVSDWRYKVGLKRRRSEA